MLNLGSSEKLQRINVTRIINGYRININKTHIE